jgi:glycerophosphoryl diester phosphodiesterase
VAYTVNDEPAARWLIDLGLDALITDAVDRFPPRAQP